MAQYNGWNASKDEGHKFASLLIIGLEEVIREKVKKPGHCVFDAM